MQDQYRRESAEFMTAARLREVPVSWSARIREVALYTILATVAKSSYMEVNGLICNFNNIEQLATPYMEVKSDSDARILQNPVQICCLCSSCGHKTLLLSNHRPPPITAWSMMQITAGIDNKDIEGLEMGEQGVLHWLQSLFEGSRVQQLSNFRFST